MRQRLRILAALLLLLLPLAGCVTPPPPSPQEVAAKRFEAVPGKAVIYVFRDAVNFEGVPSPLALDGNPVGSSYGGTFFRFVVEPGQHRLAGMYGDNGAMTITVAAGQIYFVQQTVSLMVGMVSSTFDAVGADEGRSRVSRYQLTGS
jgi:hypothetical protein